MRDLHLRHTLKQLSRDASAVFTDLVEGGQEIPYEIAEPGDSFAFCQYKPLTAKFVRDNASELRELESFGEATETMRRSDLAATYLEEAGIAPPADGVERSTLAVTYFLARLWDGCSDFEIDEDRFSAALDEVEECSEPEAGEVEAIVPLVGFQAPVSRIELSGAAIVRADTVDVPPEAARSDRPGNGEWEPTFVISARVSLDEDGGLSGAGSRVAQLFDRVVTTLRLHHGGGVGLGPYGWVRVAGDRWRRIATGAGRPRNGGYRLSEDQIESLIDLSRTVNVHPKRVGRLRRSLLRFESGLDRRGAVDALNDHLLGLRFLLEGDGPAGVGLPMRAAALAADGPERERVKATVEGAIALERELWSGEPSRSEVSSPSEVALALENLLRTILRRAVSGELGADLRAAADETLLADGLAVGEGSPTELGGTAEWEAEELEEEYAEELDEDDFGEVYAERPLEPDQEEVSPAERFERFEREPEPEIRAARIRDDQLEREFEVEEPAAEPHPAPSLASELEAATEDAEPEPPAWIEEVDERGEGLSMEFPTRSNHLDDLAKPPMDREEVKARVEYLFPRTETHWAVGQDSPRRAEAG